MSPILPSAFTWALLRRSLLEAYPTHLTKAGKSPTQPLHTMPRLRTIAIATGAAIVATSLAGSAAAVAAASAGQWQRLSGDNTQVVRAAIKDAKAKNVILLIGDGMGDSEITIARNYAYGAGGELPGIDALPLTGSYTTYSLYKDGAEQGQARLRARLCRTGTAWATGTKTYDNAICVDIDGKAQPTLLELAKTHGLRTGDVSHRRDPGRDPGRAGRPRGGPQSCYGPDSPTCGADALGRGGRGSISEQLLDTRPDLTLGGGRASFNQTAKAGEWNGQTLFAQAGDARLPGREGRGIGLAAVTKASQDRPCSACSRRPTSRPGSLPRPQPSAVRMPLLTLHAEPGRASTRDSRSRS